MPDYRQLYITSFRAMTEAIEILQKAQQETEELYMESEDGTILRLMDDSGQPDTTDDENPDD